MIGLQLDTHQCLNFPHFFLSEWLNSVFLRAYTFPIILKNTQVEELGHR